MKIYYDNQVDSATVTSPQLLTNFPPSNVKNQKLTRIYKGAEYSELQVDAGGGLLSISDAYTNLVQDPTDLTTGNWGGSALAQSISLSINGNSYTRVYKTSTSQFIRREQGITLTGDCVFSLNIKHDDADICQIRIQDETAVTSRGSVTITFSTKDISESIGTVEKYTWFDDNTVEIFFKTSGVVPANTNKIYFYPSFFSGGTNTGTLITEVQVVENTDTMYPFISGTKTADVISETFTMPDKFTFDMVVEPYFQYTETAFLRAFGWEIDVDNRLFCAWNPSNDQIYISWEDDAGGEVTLNSQTFDDGTSFANLNQRLRIVGSLDLKSGGVNDSRFVVIPLEFGAINEDTSWNGTPDIKTNAYTPLDIGHRNSSQQFNSNYEYLRIYEGLLVGAVTSSADVDTLLEDKKVLFDKTYQSKITATDLLLANTTINDGDTILLRANDVDSFNAGTPVDEVVVWDKDIIHHNFTKASHQYWWLSVNSSNAVEIGRMFLGESYTPPGIGPTVTKVRNTADVKSRSISGQTYGDRRYNFWQFITTFPACTHDEAKEIEEFFDSITSITPFFIEFNEECSDLERYYVTIDQDEVRFTTLSNTDYYTASLNFIEEKN